MMMNKALVLLVAVAACGKAKPKTDTVEIGSTGYVVDVPLGWTVTTDMPRFYSLEGGHGGPQILEETSGTPGTVDEDVKAQCEGRSDIKKDTLSNGGFWFTCKGESKMAKGVQTTVIVVKAVKDGGKGFFDCHLETDQDPATTLDVCKSIRKK